MDGNTVNLTGGHQTAEESIRVPYVLAAIVNIAIAVGSVFGNTLTIVAVVQDEQLRKLANSFIVSLAMADLLVTVLPMPVSVVYGYVLNDTLPLVPCLLINSTDLVFCIASVLNISCISMDRYIAITDPLHYSTRMTKKLAAAMITGAWLISVLCGFVPIMVRYIMEPGICYSPFSSILLALIPNLIIFIASFPMLAAYWRIFRIARKQETHVREMARQVNQGSEPRKNHKAARTLGVVIGVFMLCWLPFLTCALLVSVFSAITMPVIVFHILGGLVYCNSALNPVIYATSSRDFRKAFKKILCRIKCHTN